MATPVQKALALRSQIAAMLERTGDNVRPMGSVDEITEMCCTRKTRPASVLARRRAIVAIIEEQPKAAWVDNLVVFISKCK